MLYFFADILFFCDRYRRVTGAGEIRLEDEKGTMTTVGGNSRTCLSIQADEV